MSSTNKNKHFTLEEKRIIQIASCFETKSSLLSQYANYKHCSRHHVCRNVCPNYKKHHCHIKEHCLEKAYLSAFAKGSAFVCSIILLFASS